jgi:hypothetical protein
LRNFAPFCSPFGHYAQNPCYSLTVATPSDSVVCKVKSWLLQLIRAAKSSPQALKREYIFDDLRHE